MAAQLEKAVLNSVDVEVVARALAFNEPLPPSMPRDRFQAAVARLPFDGEVVALARPDLLEGYRGSRWYPQPLLWAAAGVPPTTRALNLYHMTRKGCGSAQPPGWFQVMLSENSQTTLQWPTNDQLLARYDVAIEAAGRLPFVTGVTTTCLSV